jgi:hypothetical protein
MKTNKFTINKDYEDIAMIEDNAFRTLKKCFKSFNYICENNEMLQPEQFSEIFKWKENKESKIIEIIFVYNYIGNKLIKTGKGTYQDEENQICKTRITSSVPIFFGMMWDVQQTFLVMEEMYILKLNKQIINKLIK